MNYIGPLDLFTIGIGPSSSHTVGPMRAAKSFAEELKNFPDFDRIQLTLYGSLAATGAGHGTTNALIAGLRGDSPESCNPEEVLGLFQKAIDEKQIEVLGKTTSFEESDLVFERKIRLEKFSNGMLFQAFALGTLVHESTYYSVGGGFIEKEGEVAKERGMVPHPYSSSAELVALANSKGMTIADIAYQNDVAIHGKEVVDQKLNQIWQAMKSCIQKGLDSEGILPGYLKVQRRAHAMRARLEEMSKSENAIGDLTAEWLQAFAIAVNEENAAGMKVVTAPTNGAAGIIPAVAYFANQFRGVDDERIAHEYLLTAGAIGTLYKLNASISGAEAGCQGEVGSACSMAAAGITAVMGGTNEQIENAAEIAMEHNLGLTCDPVGGFVQLPCIERNAIAAGTAVAAMRLALLGDGSHKISLDTVIETMRQTGADMSSKYKETSMGGLAVNVVEC
ncbi:MAG: L-serine ammonia-lyase [Actinomycetota bacterium]